MSTYYGSKDKNPARRSAYLYRKYHHQLVNPRTAQRERARARRAAMRKKFFNLLPLHGWMIVGIVALILILALFG